MPFYSHGSKLIDELGALILTACELYPPQATWKDGKRSPRPFLLLYYTTLRARLASELADLRAANANSRPACRASSYEALSPPRKKGTLLGADMREVFQFTSELEDSRALRLASELADLRAANANSRPVCRASSYEALSPPRKKGTLWVRI